MSSPENVDPAEVEASTSRSPEESHAPQKTRYGRIIVPKGDLPGEELLPRERVKRKQLREKKREEPEPVRVKRKYTKRRPRVIVSGEILPDEEEAVKAEVADVTIVKEEEPDGREHSEGLELDYSPPPSHPPGVPLTKAGVPSALPVPEPLPDSDELIPEKCEHCSKMIPRYKKEEHIIDEHPDQPLYECHSCRIRTFFNYWDLKAHYKNCSDGRIASNFEPTFEPQHSREVVEAACFRRLYLHAECPFCKIYLDTYFDLEVHLNVHGLAAMDSKFGCDGCASAFISVGALKKHLWTKNKKGRSACFNKARVLTREEIEKMKQRYSEGDRLDCIRKYNDESYVLSAPRIIEAAQEATCAYCHEKTRAYAMIKNDLSNLAQYGLKAASTAVEKEIAAKIKGMDQTKTQRVSLCRSHFQWRHWRTKEDEESSRKARTAAAPKHFVQSVVRRKEGEAGGSGGIVRDSGPVGPSHVDDHCYSAAPKRGARIKVGEAEAEEEEERRGAAERRRAEREAAGGRSDDEGAGGVEYIDLSSDEEEDPSKPRVALPLFMPKEAVEKKATSNLFTTYECPVCADSYPSLNDLHSHQHAHSESRLVYFCADCPEKRFLTPDEINEHFDVKMKSAMAGFYSFKVLVQADYLKEEIVEEGEVGSASPTNVISPPLAS